MGNLVIRGSLILNTTPGDGSGDPLLARDATTGEVGLGSSALAVTLLSGQIIVGNASNQATAVTPTGDVTISNTGVTSISAGVIVDADVNASAGIGLGKLAATTPNRALVSNGVGVISPSSVTDVEVSYLSGTTGPIQTQLAGKQATITGAATTITSTNLASNFAVISNGGGKIAVSATTSTELGYLSGTTSSVQTQLNSRLAVNLSGVAQGDLIYFNGIEWVNLPRGSSGQTLQATGTTIQWGSLTANGIPSGGTTAQVLAKQSNTDYDAIWKTLAIADITDITASASNINILTGTTVTGTEIGYLSGVTSSIQTQLTNKQNRALAYNAMWVGNGSNIASELSPGNDGDILTIVGTAPQWQPATPPGNVSGVGPSTDNAIVRWNGTTADSIQNSGLIIDDSNNITFPTGTAIRTGTSATNSLLLQAYDVDGTSYTTFGTLTAGNTPTFDLADTVTKGGQYIYRSGGTDVSLADGGTGASLTDPGADRILFWDDSGNAVTWLTVGSNLSITGTTLNATGGGGTSLQQKEVATSTYTILAGDDNYVIYFTNASGCNVTLPDSLTANFTFTSVRATGAGTVDHLAGGASVLNTVGGATDIQNEDTAVTWIYKGTNNWYGFGALGASGGAGVNSVTGTTNRISIGGTGTDPIVDIAATYVGQTSITTLGTIGTGVWQGTVVGTTYGGTGLSSIGTNGQLIRSNGTTLEYFTPTYISGNQTITLSGDVSGSGATAIATTIGSNVVSDAKFRQSAGLSIVGRSTNTTGNVADITAASDFQILRRSGTSIGFGAIDLSQAAAVGTSILPIANGGTGSSTQPWWSLTGTSTLLGVATIASNAGSQHIFNGSYTASANNQFHAQVNPTVTLRATASDVYDALDVTPALTTGANNQTINMLDLSGTYNLGATTGTVLRGILYNPTLTGNAPTGHTALAIGSGRIGLRNLTPTATLDITGEGTTAATFSMRIRDNSNVNLFQYGDDGFFRFGSLGSPPILGSAAQTSTTVSANKAGGVVWCNTVNGTVISMTSGNNGGYAPILRVFGAYDPTLVGAAAGMALSITPTINQTGTANASYTGILYNPTLTSVVGSHYGLIVAPTGASSGLGVTTPTAKLHIAAHTTSAGTAPIKLTSGTAMTTPEDGALEYHSSHLYFTIGSTRYQLDQQGSGGSISGLTAGRVPYATSATTIADEAGFEYDSTNNRLTVPNIRSASGNSTLRLEANNVTTGAYILLQDTGETLIRNQATSDWLSIIDGTITGVGTQVIIRGGVGESGATTIGSGDGSSTNNNAANTNVIAGSGYATSGNGNGGTVVVQSGQRRVAGSGSDGRIELDPRNRHTYTGRDIVIDDSSQGYILKAPNGTYYRITVNNTGDLLVNSTTLS